MQTITYRLITVLLFSFCLFGGYAQEEQGYSVANAHAHNDYANDTPFYQAFHLGFGSLEADVYPVDGALWVAHAKRELQSDRTLRRLYLNPLRQALKSGRRRQINLLVDIKEKYQQALPLLVNELKGLTHLASTPQKKGPLTVLVSGNRPDPSRYADYPDHIFFDADLSVPHTAEQWKRVGLVSLQFTRYAAWKAQGPVPAAEAARIRRIIDSVHAAGKPIRFWAAPDNPVAWAQLLAWGVDYIGTDKVAELAAFIGRGDAGPLAARSTRLTAYVNPFIGTGATDRHSLSGSTFPGATLPFGFVQLSPDTRAVPNNPDSGYDYNDSTIVGFSHTHLSGTGVADLFDVLVMPTTGAIRTDAGRENTLGEGYRSRFTHDREEARPGYYRVDLLDYGVTAELTATEHAGLHRYTFPQTDQAHVVIDLDHSRGKGRVSNYGETCKILAAQIRVVDSTTIEGYRVMTGWARLRKVYFRLELSRPLTGMLMVNGPLHHEGERIVNGTDGVKAVLTFGTRRGEPLLMKVGLSAVSLQNARENLARELVSWDFDAVAAAADRLWEAELRKIRIEGTRAQKEIFYTALYHAFTQPNNVADVNGEYQAADLSVQKAGDSVHYSTFSLWDTFRAAHPLYTLVQRERTAAFARSLLRQYETLGFLPVWQLWGDENYCMIGNHAIPVLVDAALKGFPGIDVQKVYEAVKASASRNHLYFPADAWKRYGYIPEEVQSQSVSLTLEIAYDDWCVARLARHLGREEDYRYFRRRADSYRHLYDGGTGFFRAKDRQGRWIEPFDPLEYGDNGGHPFTEGNAWQYFWFVPHDVGGLIALVGGKEAFAQKLDRFFTLEAVPSRKNNNASGFIGQYAHGNEPSHHVTYLYTYAGQPWKTQYYVSKVLRELYNNTSAGYAGNEDCGQMASWYVFSAMGFYPVNPAGGVYILGSPVLRQAAIEVGGGKVFTVNTKNASDAHPYIQSCRLNGKAYTKSYITHEDILKGGVLELEMGPRPNYRWGTTSLPAESATF